MGIKSNKRRFKRGYTIVELLVVMAIIAVIVGISVSGLLLQQQKARDARRRADLETIRAALEEQRRTDTFYDKAFLEGNISGKDFDGDGIADAPEDPRPDHGLFYLVQFGACSGDECSQYELGAHLEVNPPNNCVVISGELCGPVGEICNYCVVQP